MLGAEQAVPAVRDRLIRAVHAGVGGRYDIAIPGITGRSDREQLGQLREGLIASPQPCGPGSGTWTARLVAEHVRRRSGVQYKDISMYDILHRLGFSCGKPSRGTPNRPQSTGRRRSKKKAREIIRDSLGHRVAYLDEASHIIGWDAKSGRCPKGRLATAPAALSRKRFHPPGRWLTASSSATSATAQTATAS